MSGSDLALASFVLRGVTAHWLGPSPTLFDLDTWRLRLTFAPATPDEIAPMPALTVGAFQLMATDGGPPAAVLEVTRRPPGDVDLLVARLALPGSNSDGKAFRLLIGGAPGVVAEGAAAIVVLDHGQAPTPPDPPAEAPVTPASINYLAKDYPTILQSLQASLRLMDPSWTDVSPADVGVTLTEVLAYAADNLSYYQDAVATEAYLTTARRRLSVKRHARLMGYGQREGCAARAWVQVQVLNPVDLPRGARFLAAQRLPPVVQADTQPYREALRTGAIVFESLEEVRLDPSLNALRFHTWGQDQFHLPKGAVAAVFRDAWLDPVKGVRPRRLDPLAPGDVLMLERLSPGATPVTGLAGKGGADTRQRWPVRITRLDRLVLPLLGDRLGQPVVLVEWDEVDALPFDLPVWDVSKGGAAEDLAIAYGNIVPTDQGLTLHQALPPVSPNDAPYQPRLADGPLVFAAPYEPARQAPASLFQQPDPAEALACVSLLETQGFAQPPGSSPAGPTPAPSVEHHVWTVRRDLMGSGPFARDFVVDVDDDATTLRFGDGVFGRRPNARSAFVAVLRQGDMAAGAVAAEAIGTLVAPEGETISPWLDAVIAVRNPLAATGAAAPDPVALTRRLAAIGVQPRSLAALDDYVAAALTFGDVDQAAAELKTSGSWPLIMLYVRRRHGRLVDQAFRDAVAVSLEERLIGGRRLAVKAAQPVGVGVTLDVVIETNRFMDRMAENLNAAFSPTGGFFDLDRWPLGATLYASALVAAAMAVPGVLQASVTRLARLDRPHDPDRPAPAMAVFGAHEYPVVGASAGSTYGGVSFVLSYPNTGQAT